jgi:hypothetical protein
VGFRIKNSGATPLIIAHDFLYDYCGYQTPEDKAQAANWTLGTSVDKIEELTPEQLSTLVYKILQGA